MELGKVLEPLRAIPRERRSSFAACTTRGAERETSTARKPATCSRAAPWRAAGEIRSGTSVDQMVAKRKRAGADEGAEPGARLRDVDRVGTQELLDALQLAHFVELDRRRRLR